MRASADASDGASFDTFSITICCHVPANGGVPLQHLEQHRAHRVDVGAMIDVASPAGLLRCHVRRRAERDAFAGERRILARVADRLRDAEVHDDRMPAGEHDVVRLDVAMDDAVRVRVGERLGDLRGEAQRLRRSAAGRRAQPVAQRFAGDDRHDVVQQLAVAGDAGVEERQDVRVIQSRRDADLAQEALAGDRACEVGLEHLDGDVAIVLEVVREVDGRHAAAAELALDR